MAEKRVIIAVDNAKACEKAVDYAVTYFPKDCIFDLLHVQTAASPMLVGCGDAALLAYDDQNARDEEMAHATDHFLRKVFIPRASAKGAQVTSSVVNCPTDDSSSIGKAICQHVEKHKPVSLVMMKENKSALARFFLGSVTKYCAVHSPVPVVIVPEGRAE